MSAIGADPDQLDALAGAFEQLAASLEYRRTTLTWWLDGDRFWRGQRADEFRGQWSSTYSPQIGYAAEFLQSQARLLRDNANQQRVASGENPENAGSSFLDKLFGVGKGVDNLTHKAAGGIDGVFHHLEHGVETLAKYEARGIELEASMVAHGAGEIWNSAYHDVSVIGGSKALAEVLGVVQIVGTVAAFCPPPMDTVAVAAAGVVMLGHLAQMANQGHFQPAEFAEDAVGVGGLGALKLLGDAREAAVLGARANYVIDAGDDAAQARDLVSMSDTVRTIDQAVTGVKAVQAGSGLTSTVDNVAGDVMDHRYADAVTDVVTGGVDSVTPLGNDKAGNLGAAADLTRDAERMVTRGISNGLDDLGGSE